MNFDDANRLIHRIYDLDTDRTQWREVLTGLADACDVAVASFAVISPTRGIDVLCSGTDPALLSDYATSYVAEDPTIPAIMGADVGKVLSLDAIGGKDRFRRTEVGARFWPQTGHSPEHLRTKVHHDNQTVQLFAINARLRDDEITNATAAAYALFLPHLTRALEIERRLRSAMLRDAVSGWAKGTPGAVVVDAAMRCLHMDERATDIVERSAWLRVRGGRLTLTDTTEDAALQGLVARCKTYDILRDRPGGTLKSALGTGHLEVLPLSSDRAPLGLDWLTLSTPVALILIDDSALRLDRAALRLRQRYGLTRAEARIALEAPNAETRRALALRVGLSELTVRTHLSRIYDKTGAQRQASLARMVMALMAEG